MNDNFVNTILSCGERYRNEYLLSRRNPEVLLSDWWEGINFFFSRAFYKGRRDSISDKVYKAARGILLAMISRTDGQIDDMTLSSIEQQLQTKIGAGHVGKGGDIKMALSTLRYLRCIPSANIVTESVQHIKVGRIGQHFRELQAAVSPQTGIYQVGAKISSYDSHQLLLIWKHNL